MGSDLTQGPLTQSCKPAQTDCCKAAAYLTERVSRPSPLHSATNSRASCSWLPLLEDTASLSLTMVLSRSVLSLADGSSCTIKIVNLSYGPASVVPQIATHGTCRGTKALPTPGAFQQRFWQSAGAHHRGFCWPRHSKAFTQPDAAARLALVCRARHVQPPPTHPPLLPHPPTGSTLSPPEMLCTQHMLPRGPCWCIALNG